VTHQSCLTDGCSAGSRNKNSVESATFHRTDGGSRTAGDTAALPAYPVSRYQRQWTASTRRCRRRRRRRRRRRLGRSSLVAPPATNRRTRPVAARSDYRHKTANLPTNDCFSVDHVIRFRTGEIARPSPRTITARKTSLRPADSRQYGCTACQSAR